MGMPVQIQKEPATGSLPRPFDGLVECAPGRKSLRVSAGADEGIAIAVDLVPLQMTKNQMGPRSGTSVDCLGKRKGKQIRLGITDENPFLPVGNVARFQPTSVRCRDNQRQRSRNIFHSPAR